MEIPSEILQGGKSIELYVNNRVNGDIILMHLCVLRGLSCRKQ